MMINEQNTHDGCKDFFDRPAGEGRTQNSMSNYKNEILQNWAIACGVNLWQSSSKAEGKEDRDILAKRTRRSDVKPGKKRASLLGFNYCSKRSYVANR